MRSAEPFVLLPPGRVPPATVAVLKMSRRRVIVIDPSSAMLAPDQRVVSFCGDKKPPIFFCGERDGVDAVAEVPKVHRSPPPPYSAKSWFVIGR